MSAWWALAILAATLVARAESAIVVRPHTHLSQTKAVHLQSVAEFFEIDPAVARALGEVKLADGPREGERLEFSGAEISSILRAQKAWAKLDPKPAITIPSQVIVENIGDQVTEAQVRMELIRSWQVLCSCRVQIDSMMMPKIGAWAPGMRWRLKLRSDLVRGSFTVPLEITAAGGELKTFWVKGQVAHFKLSPVATRQLNFGERVQPEDFQMAERDITFARDAVPAETDVVGRKIRQSIPANEILYAGFLEREKALKRGDLVRMTIIESGWEVVMMGVAEQDASIGDMVKIRNSKSNQVVVATVTGRGEVKIQ